MFFPIRDSIPSSRFPFINLLLIAANVLAFIYEMMLDPQAIEAFIYQAALIPASFDPETSSVGEMAAASPSFISSMFLHASVAHLVGNLLFLWIFGDNVEDRLGHGRYLLFYVACGIVAALVQVLADLDSQIPILGASGAIGGVMGAYLVSYPRARVLTVVWFLIFVRFIWIPAVIYLGLWFVFQLISALYAPPGEAGGVAFWAHVGGFVAGVVLIFLLPKAASRRPRLAELE